MKTHNSHFFLCKANPWNLTIFLHSFFYVLKRGLLHDSCFQRHWELSLFKKVSVEKRLCMSHVRIVIYGSFKFWILLHIYAGCVRALSNILYLYIVPGLGQGSESTLAGFFQICLFVLCLNIWEVLCLIWLRLPIVERYSNNPLKQISRSDLLHKISPIKIYFSGGVLIHISPYIFFMYWKEKKNILWHHCHTNNQKSQPNQCLWFQKQRDISPSFG